MNSLVLLMVALMSLVSACSGAEDKASKPKQAMFSTKAEAEAAAPSFGCKGAHKMGDQWMVCAKHADADHKTHN